MPAFFPEPYPDELIFSICSRYHDRMCYTNGTSTERDLFACDRFKVSIDLPSNLGKLCYSLPLNNAYTTDRFIYQNTLYPLFSAFVSPQRAESLRNDMIQSSGGAPHRRVGLLRLKCLTQYLRFCPKCAEDDREKWDETYWHRIHNLQGVLTCPTHQVLLENSEVSTSYRSNRLRYAVAEKFVPLKTPCSLNSHTVLLSKLAADFQWLLNQRDLCADPTITPHRYRHLLHAQNLATYAGTINATKLHRAFLDFYSKDLLHLLGCDLNTTCTWLMRIVQKSNTTQTAIHHLLLMHFLDCPVQNFFSLPHQPTEPFGKGPWPCLNPTSNHFRKPVVKSCQVYPSQGRVKIPLGTFACHCGFTYCRKGPEQTQRSRCQFFRIKSYGPVWYAALNRLARVQGYSVKETALLLKTTPHIVRVELKRMDALKNAKAQKQSKTSSTIKKRINTALTVKCRAGWKKAMKDNPDVGRSRLGQICGYKVYHHLLEHDREWFEANSPRRRPCCVSLIQSNWKQRDPELAVLAKQTAAKIISAAGRPVRASATALARSLGVLGVIHRRENLLPLTIAAISNSAEGIEDYAIRRIRWCAQCYNDENVRPTLNNLQSHGSVSGELLKRSARIREAIAAIIQTSDR
jgi:hypothetical protein